MGYGRSTGRGAATPEGYTNQYGSAGCSNPVSKIDQHNLVSFFTRIKLSVGVTCHAYVLEIEGPFTQRSRPGRTVGESVGGILGMDNSDWSNGIRYHFVDTRHDTEFQPPLGTSVRPFVVKVECEQVCWLCTWGSAPWEAAESVPDIDRPDRGRQLVGQPKHEKDFDEGDKMTYAQVRSIQCGPYMPSSYVFLIRHPH